MNLVELAKLGEFSTNGETRKFPIPGVNRTLYEVYKIPLDKLYYNDQNGRIMTSYKKYLSEHDAPKVEVGESEYNKIFEELIYNSNKSSLNDTMLSIKNNGQNEPGVVLPDGRVIDGNRRFTSLRKLQRSEGKTKYFLAVILPLDPKRNSDVKTITEIELELQFGREERVNYNPIDRILHTYYTIEVSKTLTREEYRDKIGAGNITGINKELRLAELIIRFIELVSPDDDEKTDPIDKFHLARDLDLDGPLREIESTINKLKSNRREEIIDSVMAYLAVSKTGFGENEPKLMIRELKNNILKNEESTNYFLDAMNKDDRLDNLIDAFHENPIQSSNDLQYVLSQGESKENTMNIVHSVNRLVYKGKNDHRRTRILVQLEDFRDDLEEMDAEDFNELKQTEKIASREVLAEIRDLLFALERDLGK